MPRRPDHECLHIVRLLLVLHKNLDFSKLTCTMYAKEVDRRKLHRSHYGVQELEILKVHIFACAQLPHRVFERRSRFGK